MIFSRPGFPGFAIMAARFMNGFVFASQLPKFLDLTLAVTRVAPPWPLTFNFGIFGNYGNFGNPKVSSTSRCRLLKDCVQQKFSVSLHPQDRRLDYLQISSAQFFRRLPHPRDCPLLARFILYDSPFAHRFASRFELRLD